MFSILTVIIYGIADMFSILTIIIYGIAQIALHGFPFPRHLESHLFICLFLFW